MELPNSRTINLPINEKEYHQIIGNRAEYRKKLDALLLAYPELFPKTINYEYRFVGFYN